jgi:hypothetical protein
MNTLFLNAADTLMGLRTVSNAEMAGVALRQAVGTVSTEGEKESLSISLRQIHQYLLMESDPDYWLEQIADPRDPIDSSTMEMTSAVANERQLQARLIASVLDQLNVGSPHTVRLHSIDIAGR